MTRAPVSEAKESTTRKPLTAASANAGSQSPDLTSASMRSLQGRSATRRQYSVASRYTLLPATTTLGS